MPRTRANPKPRRPGRPPGGNVNQRDRLLDAAVRCYAEHGIAATRLRDIAARAGVTPALVHYYFGSKQQLREAVIDTRLMPVAEILRESLSGADDEPRTLVAGFVRGMHAAISRYPWLPALWVREVLSEKGALREVLIERISPQVPGRLARRLDAARRRGALNGDLDPRLLVVSLVGLTMFAVAAAPIWRRVFEAGDIDDALLQRHTLALLEHGIGGADDIH